MLIKVVLLFVALITLAGCDMCGNLVFLEKVSPNKEYKTVIFERNCGATAGFSTQISILKNKKSFPNYSGNIFIIDGHPRETLPEVTWTSDNKIKIKYKIIDKSHLLETEFEEFEIVYSNK